MKSKMIVRDVHISQLHHYMKQCNKNIMFRMNG